MSQMGAYQAPHLQRGCHSTWEENVHAKQLLKIRLYFSYFNCCRSTDTQGSQEFYNNNANANDNDNNKIQMRD